MVKIIILAIMGLFIAGCTHERGEKEVFQDQEETKDAVTVEEVEGESDKITLEDTEINDDADDDDTRDTEKEPGEEVTEKKTSMEDIPVVTAPTKADVGVLPAKASVIIKTTKGDIEVELFTGRALTVANFLKLVETDFYDGVKFHRVIPDFMIQTGDPNSKDDDWSDDGSGGPGYTFADEITPIDNLVRGSVAMANAGPGTNGSQFFIVTKKEGTPWLNGLHTHFGKVVKGMEIADAISLVEKDNDVNNHPRKDVVITDIEFIKK